jgi:hypothetical protein
VSIVIITIIRSKNIKNKKLVSKTYDSFKSLVWPTKKSTEKWLKFWLYQIGANFAKLSAFLIGVCSKCPKCKKCNNLDAKNALKNFGVFLTLFTPLFDLLIFWLGLHPKKSKKLRAKSVVNRIEKVPEFFSLFWI